MHCELSQHSNKLYLKNCMLSNSVLSSMFVYLLHRLLLSGFTVQVFKRTSHYYNELATHLSLMPCDACDILIGLNMSKVVAVCIIGLCLSNLCSQCTSNI